MFGFSICRLLLNKEKLIPITKKKADFRPFLVKEQKLLMMAQESGDEAAQMRTVGEIVKNCTFNKIDKPDTMATFDIEYMFTQIRGKSVGESIDVNLTCSECEGKTKMNINLSDISVDVPKVDNLVRLTDTISVEMRYPPFKTFIDNFKENVQETEFGFTVIRECISAVISGEERIDINDVPSKDVEDFVDSMNNQQLQNISKFVETILSLKKDIEFDCSHCGHHNEMTLQGIQDFFT